MSQPTTCPRCGSTDVIEWYGGAPDCECRVCGYRWSSGAGNIKVLTEEESRAKRPEFYPPGDDEPNEAWQAWLKIAAERLPMIEGFTISGYEVERKGVKKKLTEWLKESK